MADRTRRHRSHLLTGEEPWVRHAAAMLTSALTPPPRDDFWPLLLEYGVALLTEMKAKGPWELEKAELEKAFERMEEFLDGMDAARELLEGYWLDGSAPIGEEYPLAAGVDNVRGQNPRSHLDQSRAGRAT